MKCALNGGMRHCCEFLLSYNALWLDVTLDTPTQMHRRRQAFNSAKLGLTLKWNFSPSFIKISHHLRHDYANPFVFFLLETQNNKNIIFADSKVRRKTLRLLATKTTQHKNIFVGVAIAQWIRLCLPSWFESQEHHQCYYQFIFDLCHIERRK